MGPRVRMGVPGRGGVGWGKQRGAEKRPGRCAPRCSPHKDQTRSSPHPGQSGSIITTTSPFSTHRHTLVPRDNVSGGVPFRVSHVQTRAGRVREHVEGVELGLARVEFVELGGAKRLVGLPERPPPTLNRRERVRRRLGGLDRRFCRRRTCSRVPVPKRPDGRRQQPLFRVVARGLEH